MDNSMVFSRFISFVLSLILSLTIFSLSSCTTEEQRNRDVLASASRVEQIADSKIICEEDVDYKISACKDSEGNINIVVKNTGSEVMYGFEISGVKKDLLLRSGYDVSFTIPSANATGEIIILPMINVNGKQSVCRWNSYTVNKNITC
jgi:hypothetical protein